MRKADSLGGESMKRRWLAVVNIAIIALILAFVVFYSEYERRNTYEQEIENFENTTLTMERVIENYLQGEQGICDVWANYIGSRRMTLSEAAEFVRSSHVAKNTSAHLIYTDTRTGLSTRDKLSSSGSYEVSYSNIDIFGDLLWIADVGEEINVSRAYTNPVNGEQSLAFINKITVRDEKQDADRDALLLRVVPIDDLEEKWVFPQEEFEDAEMTMIDGDGNYIIKDSSFKNSNFFEFYKSYNSVNAADLQKLRDNVGTSFGSFTMTDSKGRACVLAHVPISTSKGWVLLSYLPENNLKSSVRDWLLIGIVTAGLILLFVINLLNMHFTNRRLQLMAREAEYANKAKTDFLSTMSHDIRTPMNAIVGLTAIAEKNLDDREAVSDNLRKISMASNHLLTLINDILDISKVESGKTTLSPLTFSIVETVENLVNLSHPMIKGKDINFSFRINRMEKEYLFADQLRLNQIFINILSNAIKYTQPGGSVSVDMKEEDSPKEGCVRLSYIVSDTGMGMSPEFMEKMYQPFSRQTDSRINSIQGTGLGLAITKQMVDLMEGSIDCQSEEGKGTTFTIVLDILIADRQLEDMKLDQINVLIVDDDEVMLETVVDSLESLGAHAEKADSGPAALDMLSRRREEKHSFDVIIIDWKMPGMDGMETLTRIRKELGSDIPVLLISSYDWSDIEDEAREAGANGFISKPLFRSTLYKKISEILGVEAKPVEPTDSYSDIAGLNILVAEDNEINWEVIHAMLSMFGITSQRAVNGRICVDMVREAAEGEYALVFMDIQMPEMNGLEATRNIRALENSWAADIPIIAMTADAFSENVSACLEAGMNGHIAKPIDIKLVIKEIRRIREERGL